MKNPLLLITTLCFALAAFGRAQEMDKAISDLATQLAKGTQDASKKKITVADFSDLDGNVNELGRFVAEELTVNLVMVKSNFSVLDRANLNKILAEHKLTATGLVDPENAKKLGMFASVDALVLGTIIPKGTNGIILTAKIITTDTAEIVGVAKAEFRTDATAQQLLAKTVRPDGTQNVEKRTPPPAPKLFGDLAVKVESLRFTNPGSYGFVNLSLIVTNMSDTKTYGVGFPFDPGHNMHLSNHRGDEFYVTDLEGIETAYERGGQIFGSVTDIPPRGSVIVSSKSQVLWGGSGGDYRPYRLQAVLLFGEEREGRHNLRKYNLVLDIK